MLLFLTWFSPARVDRRQCSADCNQKIDADSGALTIKQTRFEVASRLLRDIDEKIIDIAYELGYEDPAYFSRAFGQLAGVGPSEYRGQYCPNPR